MSTEVLTSWGRVQRFVKEAVSFANRFDSLPQLPAESQTYLACGNGKSYGDSCLNDGGLILKGRQLDRFIVFDPASGALMCKAGILLSETLSMAVPPEWFLACNAGNSILHCGRCNCQ